MKKERKQASIDLRKYYSLFLEIGMIAVLLIFIVAMNVDLQSMRHEVDLTNEQEIADVEEAIRSKQIEKPPAPPRPQVPVAVPDDKIIVEDIPDISSDFDPDQKLPIPPPPDNKKEPSEPFFKAVEQMPELIGGLASLQKNITYPEMARKAGIEGRVTVQFIVTEDGKVENPRVIRGIGGGCDEEALRAVRKAKFHPGRQRGKAVRVQYSLPVVFRLQN